MKEKIGEDAIVEDVIDDTIKVICNEVQLAAKAAGKPLECIQFIAEYNKMISALADLIKASAECKTANLLRNPIGNYLSSKSSNDRTDK